MSDGRVILPSVACDRFLTIPELIEMIEQLRLLRSNESLENLYGNMQFTLNTFHRKSPSKFETGNLIAAMNLIRTIK